MKPFLLIVISWCMMAPELKCQDIKTFHERIEDGYIIYASNNEVYPISIYLDFELTNLVVYGESKWIYVVPPKNEKCRLCKLTVFNSNIPYGFTFKYKYTIGDVTIADYDTSFVYDLPFAKGKKYMLNQGYNGKITHQNQNALDFTMPEGSEILAAREGIVVKVVKSNSQSCVQEGCEKFNNLIMILHPDGTIADYAHIKFNGTNLSVGDSVKKGDVIAYSGNTGRSSGPHLHFVCHLNSFDQWKTLETKFRIDQAGTAIYLKEGKFYYKGY